MASRPLILNPDKVAATARRLAAKMVADQADLCQLSIVGLTGNPADIAERMFDPQVSVVIVARGHAMHALMEFIMDKADLDDVELIPQQPPPDDEDGS